MKAVIKKIIKYNPIIYSIYYYVFSLLLSFLGFFIKTDSKTILFMSFGGRGFSDSPRKIYEYLNNSDTGNLNLIWAFENPLSVSGIDNNQKVKIDTFRFFVIALKAKIWITNSSVERGLKFKKSKTIYFNTWHGTPLKKMGLDIDDNQSFNSKADFNRLDKFTVQSEYEAEIFSRAFGIGLDKMFKIGLPRNDELVQVSSKRKTIRQQFGFLNSDKVILYTPTFREFKHNSLHQITSNADILMAALIKKLPDNYKILARSHYEVDIIDGISKMSNRIIDVSEYPDLNELIQASDILISDYSSVIFDYSLTEKPIFIFSYDYTEYSQRRGMYFNIEDELLSSRYVDNLSKLIIHKETLAISKVKEFKKKYLNFYGDATEKSVKYILKRLED